MKNLFVPRRMLENLSTAYWNVRLFLRNAWDFRKELMSFRRYDYQHNLDLFAKSLELTADFLDSPNSITVEASSNAEEIRKFLDCLHIAQNPYDLAATRLDYDPDVELWLHTFNKACDESNAGDVVTLKMPAVINKRNAAYHVECGKIEKEFWTKAWQLFADRAQFWWD